MYNQQFKYEQAELERKRIEKEQAEQRSRQEIKDRINAIRMIPANLMGRPARDIEKEITRLDNHGLVPADFGDQLDEAKEVRQTITGQLANMLKQQRMVEEAEAKMAPEEEPKPDHKPAEPEAIEPEPAQETEPAKAQTFELAEPDEAAPDIWKDLTDWADEHGITAEAFDDLTLIVGRYL